MTIKREGPNLWIVDACTRLNGKQIRKRATVKGTKTEAEDRYIQLRNELKGLQSSTLCCLKTFKEAIDFYLNDKGNSKNQFVFDELSNTMGACQFSELQERFYTFIQLKKREKTRRKNTVTPATINKYIAYAKAVCNYAVKYSKLETSPIATFPLQKVNNARDRVLSPDEELRLFNAVKQEAPYLEPALRFCLRVPIRRGELISMTRDQLDLFRGVIYLREGTTKNGAGAILPIPPDMLDYFQDIPAKSDYLFFRYVKKHDEYRPLGDFKKAWKNILDEAKIRNFRFHDTRH